MAPPPKNLTVKGHLVVSSLGEMRVVKNAPRLKLNEVAFPVTVTIPITWGRVQPTSISLTMPEPPEAFVTVAEAELAEEPSDAAEG